MTSNVGADKFQMEANSIGFGDSKRDLAEHDHEFDITKDEVTKELKKVFSPEFINRLDSTIVFRPLNRESIKAIIKLQIKEFEVRLKDKNIKLKLGGSTVNALAKAAYNPEFGAREVRRILQDRLETPLVEAIIAGDVEHDNAYSVKYNAKTALCEFELAKK